MKRHPRLVTIAASLRMNAKDLRSARSTEQMLRIALYVRNCAWWIEQYAAKEVIATMTKKRGSR